MTKLVLLRHGESVWNRENRFTGWTDVDLTAAGRDGGARGGRLLKDAGFTFDLAHTSVLKRAIRRSGSRSRRWTCMWLPVAHSWRLNERHYGALQGLNKAEMAAKFGEQQVLVWRRSYDVPPPALEPNDPRYAGRRSALRRARARRDPADRVPQGHRRALPPATGTGTIAPAVRDGRRVLIAAHGNSLRALVKHLDGVSDADIVGLNIPTGMPLVYELDAGLRPIRHYYLGDQAAIAAKVNAVAAQGKAAT